MTTDAIRENLARALADEDAADNAHWTHTDTSWANARDRWLIRADRLLAGPLAPLLAKLHAVEALIEQAEDRVRDTVPSTGAASLIAEGVAVSVSAGALRYALNGPPPPLPSTSNTPPPVAEEPPPCPPPTT